MIKSVVTGTDTLADDREWLYVDAASAGLFHVGDVLEAGQTVGQSTSGEAVRVSREVRVVGIEYDCEEDELILAVAPRRVRRALSLSGAPSYAR